MPRAKTEALVELSCWMEQADQLQAALAVLEARVAPRRGKKAPGAPAKAGAKKSTKPPTTGASVP